MAARKAPKTRAVKFKNSRSKNEPDPPLHSGRTDGQRDGRTQRLGQQPQRSGAGQPHAPGRLLRAGQSRAERQAHHDQLRPAHQESQRCRGQQGHQPAPAWLRCRLQGSRHDAGRGVPKPAPLIAAVTANISRIPGPPFGPS